MKTTPALTCIVVVFLATPLHSGGIKKWTDEDGAITFGDVPPPGTVDIETIRTHLPGSASTSSDYYSPTKQLIRMRAQNRQKDLQRQQKNETARQNELSRQQAITRHRLATRDRQVKMAKCSHYKARIEEYEHKTIQAYSNKSDRLNDESKLARLVKLKAAHCDLN